MLETFKARLKAKSTASGAQHLSNVRLDAMSAKLNAKFPDLTDEAEHDAKIDELYDADMFKDFQTLDDFNTAKAAREKAKKEKEAKDKKDQKDKSKTKDKTDDDDLEDDPESEMPSWFKKYKEETDAKLGAFENKEKQGSIKQKLKEKLKDIPEKFWVKRNLPETDEEIEAFADEAATDWAEMAPAEGARKVITGGLPNGKQPSKEQIDNIVNHIMQ